MRLRLGQGLTGTHATVDRFGLDLFLGFARRESRRHDNYGDRESRLGANTFNAALLLDIPSSTPPGAYAGTSQSTTSKPGPRPALARRSLMCSTWPQRSPPIGRAVARFFRFDRSCRTHAWASPAGLRGDTLKPLPLPPPQLVHGYRAAGDRADRGEERAEARDLNQADVNTRRLPRGHEWDLVAGRRKRCAWARELRERREVRAAVQQDDDGDHGKREGQSCTVRG